jgi:hypothetical protein
VVGADRFQITADDLICGGRFLLRECRCLQ